MTSLKGPMQQIFGPYRGFSFAKLFMHRTWPAPLLETLFFLTFSIWIKWGIRVKETLYYFMPAVKKETSFKYIIVFRNQIYIYYTWFNRLTYKDFWY